MLAIKHLFVTFTMVGAGLLTSLGQGQTDFFELLRTGSAAEVQAAIAAGESISARDEFGRSPLIAAARFNEDIAVVRLLLALGADVNEQDDRGQRALSVAMGNNKSLGLMFKQSAWE